jgi:DNA-binding transcriptional LysR family regulator
VLDLRLLHQTLTLAKFRNFARAAEALHLTQPALSRSIAGLEAMLGEKLFSRTQQGVVPTAFGELLIARARVLLDGASALERDFKLMRGLEVGELTIGVGAYPAEMSVASAVGRLTSRHPNLQITLRSGDLRSLVADTLAGHLDLAVIEVSMAGVEPALAAEPLPQHQARFYCRVGHPLQAEAEPSRQRLLEFPYVGTRMPARAAHDFYRLAQRGAIDPESGDYLPPVMVASVTLAKEVVLAGNAIGAAPRRLIARELAEGSLIELPVRLSWLHTAYGFVYLRDRMLSPAALALMAEVRTVEAEIVAEEVRSESVTA